MPAAAIAVMAIGTGISAYMQYRAGKEQQKGLNAQADAQVRAGKLAQEAKESEAQLAEYNAAVAELQAKDAITRGDLDANRMRSEIDQVIGRQRAGMAAGNIDVSFGSPLDIASDARYLGELDALQIKTNAAREAWGYQVQAEDARTRAAIIRKEGRYAAETGSLNASALRAQGNAASTIGWLQAGSTIATSAGSMLLAKYGYGSKAA